MGSGLGYGGIGRWVQYRYAQCRYLQFDYKVSLRHRHQEERLKLIWSRWQKCARLLAHQSSR